MEDGKIVDTTLAAQSWEEARDWNGSNYVSRNTKSQWRHQTLYLSAKGRYYLVHSNQWQGSTPSAEWLSKREAAAWLFHNDHDVPDGLHALLEEDIVE